MLSKKTTTPFYEYVALVLIGIAIFGYLVILGKDLLDPLMFGFLFAILLLPVSSFFEKKCRFPRSLSSLASILLLIAFITGILYLVGSQISNLTHDWPMLKKQVGESINNASEWIQSALHINLERQKDYVHDAAEKLMASGTEMAGTTFGALSSLMLFYVFILIFTFFILFYRRILFTFLLKAFGTQNEHIVHDIAENVQSILRQYIIGLLIEMVVVASVACTAFWIINIKYAALLGILVGLFNIIPYLGIFTALLLSVLITFATGALSSTIWVAASVIGIHAVDSNILLPTIVGSKVRLNAMFTFLGIVIGEMVWGLSGMFLSIPTIAILKIIFDRIDSLKPWGFLMGGDYEFKKSAEKEMKTE